MLTMKPSLIFGDKLSDNYYRVTDTERDEKPKMSAVQLAAAITASARIHMYKYINRPDCFYTDTDSTILGSPLPEDETSSTELGKFKLEHRLKKGIFLAPKSYALETEEDVDILKHKGAAKQFVNIEWFQSLLADPNKKKDLS
ncbi:hypothetical protein KSP39_PZI012640 [Platanthera zijinensis]|uniref:DNA-directed DNA polymerase n=1 Tax=Platanthera zijinensis TaxID=2320716 RepID=A0AAP0BET4_9ASPA